MGLFSTDDPLSDRLQIEAESYDGEDLEYDDGCHYAEVYCENSRHCGFYYDVDCDTLHEARKQEERLRSQHGKSCPECRGGLTFHYA